MSLLTPALCAALEQDLLAVSAGTATLLAKKQTKTSKEKSSLTHVANVIVSTSQSLPSPNPNLGKCTTVLKIIT